MQSQQAVCFDLSSPVGAVADADAMTCRGSSGTQIRVGPSQLAREPQLAPEHARLHPVPVQDHSSAQLKCNEWP